ncbi:MAG: hypothetical protein ACHP7E_10815 [Burkholderiales bacterium]
MSPLMMRIFTLVGMALAAASLQLKARGEMLPGVPCACVHAASPQSGLVLPGAGLH